MAGYRGYYTHPSKQNASGGDSDNLCANSQSNGQIQVKRSFNSMNGGPAATSSKALKAGYSSKPVSGYYSYSTKPSTIQQDTNLNSFLCSSEDTEYDCQSGSLNGFCDPEDPTEYSLAFRHQETTRRAIEAPSQGYRTAKVSSVGTSVSVNSVVTTSVSAGANSDGPGESAGRGLPSEGPVLPPELSLPVFQTVDASSHSDWAAFANSRLQGKGHEEEDEDEEERERRNSHFTENEEKWAWGNGKKWVGVAEAKQRLNHYASAPTARDFDNAAKVQGGFGEKYLKMLGWKPGEGLGKGGEGTVEPLGIKEVKLDRNGLVTSEESGVTSWREERLGDSLSQEQQTYRKPEEVVKAKFSTMKSEHFWNWHGEGMKGSGKLNDALKAVKKLQKARTPVNVVGKHPVSGLMELAQRKNWAEPKFSFEFTSCGRISKATVIVNGKTFSPGQPSDNKKTAKAEAAQHALEEMGYLPKSSS